MRRALWLWSLAAGIAATIGAVIGAIEVENDHT